MTRANEAVRLSPNDAAALVTRGVVAETGGDEAAAQADYEKAIGLSPSLTEARLLLGNRYMRLNRYAPAAEQYRQLIKLEPKIADHLGRLAAAQVADGRCTEALRDLEPALPKPDATEPRPYVKQIYVRVVSTCRGAADAQHRLPPAMRTNSIAGGRTAGGRSYRACACGARQLHGGQGNAGLGDLRRGP